MSERESEIHEHTIKELESLLKHQVDELKLVKRDHLSKISTETSRLQAERMRIKRARDHLAIDLEHAQQAKARFDEISLEKTKVFVKERASLV